MESFYGFAIHLRTGTFARIAPQGTIIGIEAAESGKHTAAIKNWGGDLSHDLLFIQFSGSQFGVLDQITGDYFPEGQN
jgi:hypothetical protein